MDNTQLSKPLLGDVKSMKKAALLSMIVDEESKLHQINPFFVQVGNEKAELDSMREAILNISVVFDSLLPSEINVTYAITSMVKLSDNTHYLACTFEGLALYINIKTKTFDEKKIGDYLSGVAVLKGEQKAIFYGQTTLYEVNLPSLLPVKEKTSNLGFIQKLIQSYDQNSLYVILNHQILKVNPENFEEREGILEGNFIQMALSKTGEIVTLSSDGKLALTNLQTSSKQEVQANIDNNITTMNFSPNESKIIAASSRTVVIINVTPLEVSKVFKMKEDIFSPLIANDENTLIFGNSNGKLMFWDIKNKEQISEFQVHSLKIWVVKLSSDGKSIYSAGLDGKICSLNFPDFTKDLSTKVIDFDISPSESKLIVRRSNENISIWDLVNNKFESIDTIDGLYIRGYDLVEESTIIFLSYNSIIKYNAKTKEKSFIYLKDDDADEIYACALSPNKENYATGGWSQKVFLWDIKTMKKVKEFKGSDWYISRIAFLQSSNVIVAGNQIGSVYFWNISTGEYIIQPIKLKGDQNQAIISLNAFQKEENVIIGCQNGSIFIYNWRAQSFLATFKAGGEIKGVDIVKDEKSMIIATKEGKITFWSLKTYNQLFYYDIKQEIVIFHLTADEKYLAYKINKKEEKDKKEGEKGEEEKWEKVDYDADNLIIKKNPLKTNVVIAAGPGNESSYMKYVMDLIYSKGKQHEPENDKWIIMPYRINTLHLYSYFNHPNQLKLALNAGGSIYDTNFGGNALSLAIKKKFSGCVNAIVSSFGKLLKENPNALNFVSQDCIIGLNKLGYPSLTEFYKLIYSPYKGKFIKFVNWSLPTPIYYHSKEIYPLESNFLLTKQDYPDIKPVTCMLTSLPLPLTNGSKASTDFLDSLEESPNSDIFTTKLIQDILDHKWEDLKWAMYWQAIIYTIYMVLLSVYLLYFIGQSLPLVIIFIFSLLLSSYEVFQFITSPSEYLEDIWNYIDAIRTILIIVYVSLNWAENEHSDLSYDILVGLVVVSWMRGITYFRVFKNTRYMVNLITQVIKDITSFLILLLYSTIAFAFIFLAMDRNDPKLIDYIKLSYRLDLGDFDSSGFNSTQWACLFLATMINMIVMLNLLISIMGDTFGRVQENAEIADRKELLGMISEIETLMFWKKTFNERSYFQALIGEESEETEKNINTRVAIMKKNIKIFHLQYMKKFETLEEMIKKIWTKLEEDKKADKEEDKHSNKGSKEQSGEKSEEKSGEEEEE